MTAMGHVCPSWCVVQRQPYSKSSLSLSLRRALLDDGELWQDIPKLGDERVQSRQAVTFISDQDRE
jgi:hypothetical protein